MDALAPRLAAEPVLAEPYAEALERYVTLGGGDLEVRAHELVGDRGLPQDRLALPLGTLSGGEAARASLPT